MKEQPEAAPFSFVELPPARSLAKPRASGITMVCDFGLPLGQVGDHLELSGRYVDLAKIAVGTSRLYALDYLRRKLALYQKHGARTFIGGQFQEYVFATYGGRALPDFFREARRIGFEIVEVSDNCIPLSKAERTAQIKLAIEHGLTVFGEVGAKDKKQSARVLVGQAEDCFAAGAELVLVEAAELVVDGKPNAKLLNGIRKSLDLSRVLIELPGAWISGVNPSAIEDMKKLLVGELGPDVNIANVQLADVMQLEALRVGLGVVGPRPAKKKRVSGGRATRR